MKTSIKTLTTICTVIMGLSMAAQRSRNGTQLQNQNQPSQNNNQGDKRHGWASNNHHGPNWGGNVTIQIGGNPNPYYNNYGYGNGYNYYNVRKAARNSVRQSANIIMQALQFTEWNDIYSPWLAKAIRHQQYAKQLYFWGDYAGALNHAERAGFLAWNTLDYFNNPYTYNNNSYPDPYSNPNNPYYRQSSPNSSPQSDEYNNEDYGYRKGSTDKAPENSDASKRQGNIGNTKREAKPELERDLPQSNISDKELLKTNTKDLDID
ncbi:MAG: hypothetical protein V4565_00015 [Bacteroidota bacterium]